MSISETVQNMPRTMFVTINIALDDREYEIKKWVAQYGDSEGHWAERLQRITEARNYLRQERYPALYKDAA